MWQNSISKQLTQVHQLHHYFLSVFRNGFLTEIFFLLLSQMMWFISSRCYGPMVSRRKIALLHLQPHDTAQQTEGQGSNSCIEKSLPAWGLSAVSLNKQKQMRRKKKKKNDELHHKCCCTNKQNWLTCNFASCLVTTKAHTERHKSEVTLVLSAMIKSLGCLMSLTGIQFAADGCYDFQCRGKVIQNQNLKVTLITELLLNFTNVIAG